ncbi:MAG TPA: hypothetical protein VGI61_04770 [Parafilimonas sp.]|jgi:hypothetical protein
MFPDDPDVITQYVQLSKAVEQSFNIKQELCEAYNIYLELIEVQKKLADAERSFAKLN